MRMERADPLGAAIVGSVIDNDYRCQRKALAIERLQHPQDPVPAIMIDNQGSDRGFPRDHRRRFPITVA